MNVSASAALQFRSIRALMLRRIRTRYVGSRVGYVWAFVELLAWVFILKIVFAHNALQRPPLGTSHEVFFMNGLVIARTTRMAIGSVIGALAKKPRGLFPMMNRMDMAYAGWALDMGTGGVTLVLGLIGLSIFGFYAVPADPLTCVVAFAAAAFFSLGAGLTLALVFTLAPGLAHFKQIILMALWFTSGFTILLDRAPPGIRKLFAWNPMMHCMEWFREGFYAGYECMSIDRTYVLSVSVALLMIGLMGERALRRSSERAIA